MKPILKLLTLLLCLHFCATAAFAQSNKKAFYGIWELNKAASGSGQELQNSSPGYLKIFNTDGTFSNVQARYSGAVISHSGTYNVSKDGYYIEKALTSMSELPYVFRGKEVKINYSFSENEKWLTLNFTVESGIAFTEVWRKL